PTRSRFTSRRRRPNRHRQHTSRGGGGHILRRVSISRTAAVLAVAALLVACAPEPTASALTATGIANLKSAKTVQLDGSGSIALKAQSGLSFAFDYKLCGNAEPPDRAWRSAQTTVLGHDFTVETIAIAG